MEHGQILKDADGPAPFQHSWILPSKRSGAYANGLLWFYDKQHKLLVTRHGTLCTTFL